VFAGAARRGTATRVLTGSLALLAVAVLSGVVLLQSMQCGDGMTRDLAAHAGASLSAHAAPAGLVSGPGDATGRAAGASDRNDAGPCTTALIAAPIIAAPLTGANVTHARHRVDPPGDAAADRPSATDVGPPLSRFCVLRT